jgi:hypothetical protein
MHDGLHDYAHRSAGGLHQSTHACAHTAHTGSDLRVFSASITGEPALDLIFISLLTKNLAMHDYASSYASWKAVDGE